jgi:hypothetical protein
MISSAYIFFISCIPLARSGIGMVFCLYSSSWIIALILSSSLSQCWTYGSSSNLVQSCTTLLRNSAVVLTCCSICYSCVVASCFLCSFITGGVVGVETKFNISSLNLKLHYFLVMELPLVLKRSQKSFEIFWFRDLAIHKV